MSETPGILLVCDTLPENPWARDRLPAIRLALSGHRHVIMDIYDFGSSEEAHRLHRRNGRRFFQDHHVVGLNRIFRKQVLASGCRIVVLGTVDNYSRYLLPATIRELQAAGCFMVGIMGDDEFTFDRNWPYALLFDRVVAYVQPMVSRYNALRAGCCMYLPNSCYFSERDYSALQIPEERKRHDVALFGSVFPARLRLVERLADRGVPLSLFGGAGWVRSEKLRPFYRGFVASADFDRTVRESRLVLALLEDHLSGATHMNTKIWEAVRNGQMCLATRYTPLVEDYGLVEGEDIVFYDSADDLASKLLYYLARPDERQAMAERLFHKIKQRFDYGDLYRRLFSELIQAAQQPRETLPPVTAAAVTLLGAPADTAAAGFPVWRFRRGLGWRRRVAAEFQTRVRTDYVILTDGRFQFDPCLHAWLALGPREPGPGVWRLQTAGDNTPGSGALLWDAVTFEAVVLRGSWWQRFHALAAVPGFPATRPALRLGGQWTGWVGARVARGYRLVWSRLASWCLAMKSKRMVG